MNPVGPVIELIANTLRLLRNLIAAALPAPEFVVVTVSGPLPERREPPGGLLSWFLARRGLLELGPAGPQESLEEWRERLRVLAGEPRVRGIVLKITDLTAGPASVESLRAALTAFRGSGKRVVAYAASLDLKAYWLASAADSIVVPESAEIALHGPRTEVSFLRVAFDRLGLLPQFHHIAEYKTAAHRFIYPRMTAAQREMMDALLDGLYAEMLSSIASSRTLSEAAVREAIDDGLLSATMMHGKGLIDAVAFEDELPAMLGTERSARIVPWAQARRGIRLPYRWRSLERRAIGVVQLIGAIVPGESRDLPVPVPLLGAHLAGHETIARAFRAAERSPFIKAVVFHVESGGGSAVASDMIWREVERVRRSKPVVVFMGNVAGSGGYYVACGSAHIVVGATTLTGSIGVVAGKVSAHPLAEKIGVRREVLGRGQTATMFSGFTAFTEREWAALRWWMEEVYVRFTGRVAAGRRKPAPEIDALARGRVYTGRQALGLGLVDEVGDFESAVRRAKSLAGIPVDADIPVVTVRPPKAAAVPSAAGAAWLDSLGRAVRLMQEPALLLMGLDVEI
ncbi:MAG TPA: S49 family peptidase [bacterium]|nr:S49 family peptidase [bacterium]